MNDNPIRLGMVLTPPSDHHFRLAAQIGATDFVARYTTVNTEQKLVEVYGQAKSYGLRLSVIEGYLPIDAIVRGKPERDAQIAEVQRLIRQMGEMDIPILCYNFMQSDWTRTSLEAPERGGARTSAFNLADLEGDLLPPDERHTTQQMWDNLAYFLERVVPVAEAAGVKLAMHPDDPPLPMLQGSAQIMYSIECYERLFEMFPSPANGMCFCQGTFAEMGVDVPQTIRHFAGRIHYVHFRDVRGCATQFLETFHDNGQTNMAAAMLAYKEVGFAGPMRPDHVPKLDGEEGPADGYSMLGRLFAVGYMRGLLHAVEELTNEENRVNTFNEGLVLNGQAK